MQEELYVYSRVLSDRINQNKLTYNLTDSMRLIASYVSPFIVLRKLII